MSGHWACLLRLVLPSLGLALLAAGPSADQAELFEKKIRPVLSEKCYSCHSSSMKSPLGGLRLDTPGGLRKGGDSGPAVVPGDSAASRLYKALTYRDLHLKMPPSGMLPEAQIEDFRRWIEAGAADPRAEAPAAPPAKHSIDWEQARRHWAFRPLGMASPPPVRDRSWPASPVDRFLIAKLEEKGLKPAPAAGKRTWLRRVTYDLTGLPPSPQEIRDYLADSSPDADTKVVERLLASPHYGERWARHWLDLVRFAETNGHEFDNNKLDAWLYRDYVIRAFNEDIPYNVFVREHLAGDLLPEKRAGLAHYESPVGTSAYWFGEVLNSATDSVKSRADQVDNQIDVFGKAFLGLTLACARCHDHKFDPVTMADYYGLAGIMHSTSMIEAVVDTPERERQIAVARERVAAINSEISSLLAPWTSAPVPAVSLRPGDVLFEDFEADSYGDWTVSGQAFGGGPRRTAAPNQPLRGYRGEGAANSFGEGTDRLVGSLTSKKFVMPKLWVHVRLAGAKTDRSLRESADLRVTVVADDHKSEHFVPDGSGGFTWKSIRMTKEINRICYFEIVDRSRSGHIVVDKIVISDSEKPPQHEADPGDAPLRHEDLAMRLAPAARGKLAALQRERAAAEDGLPESAFAMISRDEQPRNARIHIRGNHNNLGPEAPRRFLQVLALPGQPGVGAGSGRLELASWISDPRNPLTARVMVNRIWRHHFGRGLAATPDNFGIAGEQPSHPELLDWLARRFIESGWSIKEIHRLLVLSSAYRLSGRRNAAAHRADPQNRLVHHLPARRLEGETIRDALLAVSGILDPKLYGPGVVPYISKYQEGRGKPASGPLDGEGRRSIYIQVRRNFLTPMFLAYDYPLPVSAIGQRTSSNVPSQALLMMNSELVALAARRWAEQLLQASSSEAERVGLAYESAFGRPPEEWETREILTFAAAQRRRYEDLPPDNGAAEPELRAWADVCHVLFNSPEFIYVP